MKIDQNSLWHVSKIDMILNLYLDWTTSNDVDFFQDKMDIFVPSLVKQFPFNRHLTTCKKRERLLLTIFAGLNFSILSLKQLVIVPINSVVIQKLHYLLLGLLSFVSRKIHGTLAYEMSVKDNQIYSDIGNSATLLSQILFESCIVLIDNYCKTAHGSFKSVLKCWVHSFDTTNSCSLGILDDFIRNLTSLYSDMINYSPSQLKVTSNY